MTKDPNKIGLIIICVAALLSVMIGVATGKNFSKTTAPELSLPEPTAAASFRVKPGQTIEAPPEEVVEASKGSIECVAICNYLCIEKNLANTKDTLCRAPEPQDICYQNAECRVQQTGRCGWTETEKLKDCLEANKQK